MLKQMRMLSWSFVAVFFAGTIFLSLQWALSNRNEDNASTRLGGAFTLINHQGNTVNEAVFSDKPYVLFFGFTHCPEVCPTSLYELSGWIETLGEKSQDMVFVFVSVDPERDTPEILNEYLSAFSSQILGLTGTLEQVDHMVKLYRAYYQKVPLEGDDYTLNHTASFYLMRSDGSFQGTISYGENPDTALQKLQMLANARL